MRKGSKKPKEPTLDEIESMGIVSTRQLAESDRLVRPLTRFDLIEVHNILLRLCDACHDMDTKTEPWASIRKDIENLR